MQDSPFQSINQYVTVFQKAFLAKVLMPYIQDSSVLWPSSIMPLYWLWDHPCRILLFCDCPCCKGSWDPMLDPHVLGLCPCCKGFETIHAGFLCFVTVPFLQWLWDLPGLIPLFYDCALVAKALRPSMLDSSVVWLCPCCKGSETIQAWFLCCVTVPLWQRLWDHPC